MTVFFRWPTTSLLGCLSICGVLNAEVIGIVGGGTNGSGSGNVFLVESSGALIPVTAASTLGTVTINSVAMNSSALSVVGGNATNHNYGALIDSQGGVVQISNSEVVNTGYLSVGINSLGNSIFVGGDNGTPLAVKADSSGNSTTISGYNTGCFSPLGRGTLDGGASINNSDLTVFGGHPGQNPNTGITAASVFPGSASVNQVLCQLTNDGTSRIFSVAVNQSGQAIAGGFLSGNRYAALFNATQVSPTTTVISLPSGGQINSVAINESGTSLIGGLDNANAAYAVLVDPSGALKLLSGDSLPIQGTINSVDMTAGCGNGIIGGQDATIPAAYAALMNPSGELSTIPGLPTGAGASINSVSMNAWGVSLVGGTYDGTNAYAALVAPSGALTSLDVTGPPILSVSIRNFVPSVSLSKKDLKFAQYINDFAPEKACHFIPALAAGKFRKALQSASPARNAISLFVADNNIFVLNKSLSVHLRHQRHFNNPSFSSRQGQMAMNDDPADLVDAGDYFEDSSWDDDHAMIASSEGEFDFYFPEDELLADTAPYSQEPYFHSSYNPERPTSLWFEGIGYLASQKAQHGIVGFDPYAGGFILGIDHAANQHWRAGAGAAYSLTYVREHEHAGHSHINQEYLFTYTTWSSQHFYFDAALWGGAFQIEQKRNIDLGKFQFHAKSNPIGWQLSPHVEFGYEYAFATRWFKSSPQYSGILLSPFAMIDWVNAWQDRYKEKGNSPFNAGQKSHYSSFLRAEAGLRVYELLSFSSWRLVFEEAVSYVNKTPFNVGKMQTFFVGIPGSITLETLSDSQNLGALELSTQFEPFDQSYPYGSLTYFGEFNGSFNSHQLSLEIAWDF